jgi:hypothetical protein
VLALQRKVSLELQDEFRKIEQVKLQKHFGFLSKIVLLEEKKSFGTKGVSAACKTWIYAYANTINIFF